MEGWAAVLKRPAFQFYPADWRKDLALRKCSLAARGMWVEILCIAHECDPYGTLLHNGEALQADDIAGLVGMCSPREAKSLIDELLRKGVARIDEKGLIYSKRMVEDERIRNARAEGGKAGAEHGAKGAEHGAKGGRPAASKGGAKGGSETPLDGSSKPPPSSSSSSSAEELSGAKAPSSAGADLLGDREDGEKPAGKSRLPPCPYEQIVGLYHEVLPELPGVRVLDDYRRKAIRALWSFPLTEKRLDGSQRATNAATAIAWIRDFFNQARHDDWLMGRIERTGEHKNWRCTLEFLSTSKCIKRVLEQTEVSA